MHGIRTHILVAAVAFLVAVSHNARSDTIYVPQQYPTIQVAIDAGANAGDEIIVAAGTYYEAINFNGKAVYLHSADGPETTVIDATGLNASVVTCASGEGPDTILDGFTITGGQARAIGHGGCLVGGGIEVNASSPRLERCVITTNNGSGVDVSFGDPVLSDSVIAANTGIGVCWNKRGKVNISGCVIELNGGFGIDFVAWGGAPEGCLTLGADAGSTITDCVIRNNAEGGIIGVVSGSESPALLIARCSVLGNGPSYENWYSAVDLEGGEDCHISSCVIAGNHDRGMSCSSGSYSITGCALIGNDGGGIMGWSAVLSIANSALVSNESSWRGAGVLLLEFGSDRLASTLSNTLIRGNTAPEGAQIALIRQSSYYWPTELTVDYSDVEGGREGVWLDPGTILNWRDGNIDTDPLFVRNPDAGPDGQWGSTDDDYGDLHLTQGSPCIDAGNSAFIPEPRERDLDGRLRVWDGDGNGSRVIDMGAYEFGAPIPGDVDGDCRVGLSDLATLLSRFGTPSGATYADGDLDFDGDVDLQDLATLLSVFGTTCP